MGGNSVKKPYRLRSERMHRSARRSRDLHVHVEFASRLLSSTSAVLLFCFLALSLSPSRSLFFPTTNHYGRHSLFLLLSPNLTRRLIVPSSALTHPCRLPSAETLPEDADDRSPPSPAFSPTIPFRKPSPSFSPLFLDLADPPFPCKRRRVSNPTLKRRRPTSRLLNAAFLLTFPL